MIKMVRKGYSGEYACKKENEKLFGKGNCIKVAIGGSSDFIIISCRELVKIIEVKETKKNKYYPSQKEKHQFKEIIKLGKQHCVPVELWVYYKKGRGRKTIKEIKTIYSL